MQQLLQQSTPNLTPSDSVMLATALHEHYGMNVLTNLSDFDVARSAMVYMYCMQSEIYLLLEY